MKKKNRKITVKRFALGTLMHMLALCISILVSFIVMNSYIIVDNMYGEKVRYNIAFLENSEAFEESDIFTDMLRNSINDITRFTVYKSQMETDGAFDPNKKIDVTAFVNRNSAKSKCNVTAVYYLDDLIKWDRYGIQMQESSFDSKQEFLMFFDIAYLFDIFTQLDAEITVPVGEDVTSETIDDAMRLILTTRLANPQTASEVFEVVVEQMQELAGKTVEVVTENGKEKVKLTMLNCRYQTVDGKNILNLVDNWIDYSMLEANVLETIDNMGYSYSQYSNRNEEYYFGNTNVQFMIRTTTSEGVFDYTNLPSSQKGRDAASLNEYFEYLGKYVIYSKDNMNFQTNTDITEEEMFNNVSGYESAYPDNTKIWVGVDTKFKAQEDQYAHVNDTYDTIVPKIWYIVVGIIFCSLIWIILWIYFTFTAAHMYDENGKSLARLNTFDKVPTEVMGGMMFVTVIGFLVAFMKMSELLENNIYYKYENWIADNSYAKTYFLLLSALFGVGISVFVHLYWCSFVRRLHFGVLWRGSISCRILKGIVRLLGGVTSNRMVVVRTLIPYNVFLIFNLCGILGIYMTIRMDQLYFVLCVAGLVLVDVVVGLYLYKRASEVNEIIDGIARIRSGDVEYVLESEKLHGDNRTLAEAVNNIGEGIRVAVETSMKDERTKADLITNVSHDIKTPLTSIINYVALLKRENIQTEPVKGYIEILDAKTQRLKHLTDDLVEASKISSGNIVLENAQMDFNELIKQATGEFSEKFEDCGLTVVMNDCRDYTTIYADNRRMWRVVENLYNNVCKYAMPNTRVYVDIHNQNGKVEASIKNISANPLNIKPEELTERFIRGDISRTTEGSGLGLSIAKNLTELQGGEMIIFLDGDLFKVTLRFPEYRAEGK